MARVTEVVYVDDIDGSELTDDNRDVVLFSYDGVDYRLDVSCDNAEAVRTTLADLAAKATAVDKPANKQATARAKRARERTRKIRTWARQQGMEVSSRGRLSAEIVAAYEEAMGAQ